MRTKRNRVFILAALLLLMSAGVAGAEEKISGNVKTIDLETNTVVVTTYEGQVVTITISAEDSLTLNKLKERRIKVDDDIKVRFINKDGKNVATYFKKTAGC
jgi:type IV pilus biogenesis protein CpaD/CtpE